MRFFIVSIFLIARIARAQDSAPLPDDPPILNEGHQIRFSVSLISETSFYSGLRVPLADITNLAFIEPNFSYRHNRRWRFTTSLAGELSTTQETHSRVLVRETYFGLSAGDFDFTAGKRIVRWGTGYGFTPTGVLDPPRDPTDPQDHLGLNQGLEMLTADWVKGKSALTAAWATSRVFGNTTSPRRDTFALRYNVLFHGFDIAAITAHDRGGRNLWGGNFTRVFGQAIELHGEFAKRTTSTMLIGGKYTEPSGWSAVAEYYTPGANWTTPSPRRHYYFARVAKSRLRELPGWKEWGVAAYVVGNLKDGSYVVIAEVNRRMGDHFSSYIRAQLPGGSPRSDFGAIPYNALTSL